MRKKGRRKKNTEKNQKKCTKQKNASKSTPVQRNDVIFFLPESSQRAAAPQRGPRAQKWRRRRPGPFFPDFFFHMFFSIYFFHIFFLAVFFVQFFVRIWFGGRFSGTFFGTFWPGNWRSVKTAFKRVLNIANTFELLFKLLWKGPEKAQKVTFELVLIIPGNSP